MTTAMVAVFVAGSVSAAGTAQAATKVPTGTTLSLSPPPAPNVYVADDANKVVFSVPNMICQFCRGQSQLKAPTGVAVDAAAGNVYVVDYDRSWLYVAPAGGGPPRTVELGLSLPLGVAVDAAGDVFIADAGNYRVVKVPAGGGAQTTVGSGLTPVGVAVDAAGDVFIANDILGNGQVVEIPAGGGAQTIVASGFNVPAGVAVDAVGDIFVAIYGSSQLVEIPAGGGAQITLGSGLSHPSDVAVDAAGDVFIADTYNHRVV
ncbi:MAG: NHL repeat-containing protein, partial [Acidimicrobiales bacterium]